MAYAKPRSANRDMHAGLTDGAYKKAAPNRGGVVEDTFTVYRQQMSGAWHGFNELQAKMLPDGRSDHPPYYFDVAPEDTENI